MKTYPLLLLPAEFDRLEQSLALVATQLQSNSAVDSRSLVLQLAGRLKTAASRTHYNRTEAAGLIGCSAKWLREKITDLPPRSDVPVNRVFSLALPRLTMYGHRLAVSPKQCARVLMVTPLDLQLLAKATQQLMYVSPGEVSVETLAGWLALCSDFTANIPYVETLTHWGQKLYSRTPPRQTQYIDPTRRGIFYRTKIRPGVMQLVFPEGAGSLHINRGRLLRSEVAIFGRNSWAIQQSDSDIMLTDVARILFPSPPQ